MQSEIHVIGIDPGGTTGWCRLTVPRKSLFGTDKSQIVEWDHGTFHGSEEDQVLHICRLVREVQGLSYRIGPALIVEDWDSDPSFKTTDKEALSPVRIGAMLRFAKAMSPTDTRHMLLGDATLTFQGRTIAKSTATDDRLKAWGLYVPNDHIRDATRHAIVALRRARKDPALRTAMWPYAAQYEV